ncbi:nuclear transport factor 2 family protein [Rhodococcus sp. USK13]|uniref:nuclear transport factor 2 family protein n=1 Tax=Rhodococcus sp. USK13 TaxID=2806442 RepID=UPI001BD071DA|nr:nuclear transport factor 2 family protein [Rhodococcus sp. USK13]
MELLSELRSRIEIADGLAALAQAQDAHDWKVVAGFFLPNATYTHPGGTLVGVDAIVDRIVRALDRLDASQHLVGSIVTRLDEEGAASVAHFQALHVRVGTVGGDLYTIGGSYADRWVQTDDGWRIASRTQTYQWREGNRDVIAAPSE